MKNAKSVVTVLASAFVLALSAGRINALQFQSASLEGLSQTAAIGADAGLAGNSFDGSRALGQSSAAPSVYAGRPSLVGPTLSPAPAAHAPQAEHLATAQEPAMGQARPEPPAPAQDGFFDGFGKSIVAPIKGTVKGAVEGVKGGIETGKKIAGTPGAVAMGIMVGVLGLAVGAVAGVAKGVVGLCKAFGQLFKGNL